MVDTGVSGGQNLVPMDRSPQSDPPGTETQAQRSSVPCKYCPARIVWAKNTKTDKPAPIEAEPSDRGNVIFSATREYYSVLSGEVLETARAEGQALHLNHFATCRGAHRARREKERSR